jgi:hypothetical protein
MSIIRLPHLSESIPAGRLAIIPAKADIAATMPTPEGSAPRCEAKRGSTGLFEIVELKIAKNPVVHKIRKGLNFIIQSDPASLMKLIFY